MLEEVLKVLSPQNNSNYIDATFGAGGHTRAILESPSNCRVIGIDRDPTVKIFAENLQNEFPNRLQFINAKFSSIKEVAGSQQISGVLFDIGVSSMQINNPERGFSFMKDGPLTMTMGDNEISAYDVINHYSEDEIASILWECGEEKQSNKIAQAICKYRKISPIKTTLELAEIVKLVVHKRGKIHPATLTFQAIRVFVNNELKELAKGLKDAIEFIEVGGKIVIITFQGLEDKIVKDIFKQYTYKSHTNKFKEQAIHDKLFQNVTKNVLKPSKYEIKRNLRARSAKIRAVIRTK